MALQRAVALEPDLAEGLARLGRILWYRDGDYRGAEKYLSRALAIAPDDVVVLISASSMLKDLGRFREALEHCGRATVLDPVGVLAWQATAYASFLGGDLARAEIAARRTLELAPQRVFGHALLGLILQLQGHDQEGLDEASKEPDDFWRSWALSMLHYRAGRKAESDHELAKLIDEAGHDSQFQIAEVHAARGEIEDSFEWLARAVESGDPGKVGMKVSPFLKTLHSDSRWIPLLRKVGFPSIEDDI